MLLRISIALMVFGGLGLAASSRAESPASRKMKSPDSSTVESTEKIRALLVTGGCCHDYENQKRLISEGLSERIAGIEWTIVDYGSARDVKADVYKKTDWITDFDIVVHNECFGGVTDGEFVRGIVAAHVRHQIPAIVIHCSMHSYRNAPAAAADRWRSFLGVTSRRHERKKRPLAIRFTDAGKTHAATAPVGPGWTTPNGELYIIEKVWPTAVVLATSASDETGQAEPVIWTNQLEQTRVFGISLGHHNETIADLKWQDIVAGGFRWALQQAP